MRWQTGRRSKNVEDRRGQKMAMGAGGAYALFRFLPYLLRSKIGRTLLIFGVVGIVAAKLLGIDVLPMLTGGGSVSQSANTPAKLSPAEQELTEFVSVVLADTETTWQKIFQQANLQYQEPTMVLFSGAVMSACGRAGASVGPFYCPMDQKLYIDLSFYQDLKNRHDAPGDFAQAYVIAHEVGHHVQTLLGISEQVMAQRSRVSKEAGNALSVRQELQADCFAGIWGYHADTQRQILEPGDLQEALVAASAIGDDRLQRQASGYVIPESFTHGSSAQRVAWFRRGFESGNMADCDTFSATHL